MDVARSLIGCAEIKGPRHESRILAMWDDIKCGWFKDDETPWCAAFVGSCLERAGFRSTRSAAARSYEKWGFDYLCHSRTTIPYGAIVVLSRPGAPGSGHVGFYCGPSGSGFALLGGNQNDAVRVSSFLWPRIVAVRWPQNGPAPGYEYPPLGSLVASRSEA
jgi:uncharacterized protein (TIGR02594 family)